MNQQPDDPLFRQLARLAPVVPDEVHSASVRARCHSALARRRRRMHQPAADGRVARRWTWELAVAAGFAAVYLSAVIQQALMMYGLR